jgi:hypothetical protein
MNNPINYDHVHNQGLAQLDFEADTFMSVDLTTIMSRKFNFISRGFDTTEMENLVSFYYQIEDTRVSLLDLNDSKNSQVFKSYSHYLKGIENSTTPIFSDYNHSTVTGNWALQQPGIGQAASAALLSNVNINKAPTFESLWTYCGLNPSAAQPGSWNPFLKNLTWKIGKSFATLPDSFYGELYTKELDRRIKQRDASGADTEDSRLEAQARRYATKIFLSHWHQIRYLEVTGEAPPVPFKSSSYIAPPNNPY